LSGRGVGIIKFSTTPVLLQKLTRQDWHIKIKELEALWETLLGIKIFPEEPQLQLCSETRTET